MASSIVKRVFISHTGREASIALLLKEWINMNFYPTVEAFVSRSDISAGTQWLRAVEKALRSADLVLALCSPKSIRKTWLLFETGGAWGRSVPVLPICLSGLDVSDLPSPLNAFEGISTSTPDFAARLAAGIQQCLSFTTSDIDTQLLMEDLPTVIRATRITAGNFDVFVSVPMSSLNSSTYQGFRKSLEVILDALSSSPNLSRFYFAGKAHGDVEDFDEKHVGAKRDFEALANSDRYLMILPEKLPSSVLVEAGFALALGTPSLLCVPHRDYLPYALQEIGQLALNVNVIPFERLVDLSAKIKRYGSNLWPQAWGWTYV